MDSKYKHLVALTLVQLFLVTGCVTTGGRSGWPVQTYTYTCESGMIPSEPICLISGGIDGGFKYNDQFVACRQSLMNYTAALDDFYICSEEKLTNIFNELLKQVPETFNCYVNFFKSKREGNPSLECPPVQVPRFSPFYEANGLEINLGVPRCIAKNNEYNFAPSMAYQLDDCREQVEVFTDKAIFGHSFNAASAKNQHDTYLNNLRWVLEEKAQDAVRKFNCIAERQKYCF